MVEAAATYLDCGVKRSAMPLSARRLAGMGALLLERLQRRPDESAAGGSGVEFEEVAADGRSFLASAHSAYDGQQTRITLASRL